MSPGIFLVGSFVKKRFFCFFCPMSALQFLFSRIGLLRLIKDGDKCTRCGNCSRVCDVGIKEIAESIMVVSEQENIAAGQKLLIFQKKT